MSVSHEVPLRADAQRNLERIRTAAREAFAERGLEVSVEEIARRAGVGKATLFRRYPTKDALVLAVTEDFLAEIEASAERAAEAGDPWDGLLGFVRDHACMMAENAGFFDAMAARLHQGLQYPEELLDRKVAAAERALEPARRAGLIREGVCGRDLLTLLQMLGQAIRPAPGAHVDEATWSRYMELLLSGIRAGQEKLPGQPLDICALARQVARPGA